MSDFSHKLHDSLSTFRLATDVDVSLIDADGELAERFGNPCAYCELIASDLHPDASRIVSRGLQYIRRNYRGAITQSVGYSNQQYFSRVFKAETGMTPGQYKRKYKNSLLKE